MPKKGDNTNLLLIIMAAVLVFAYAVPMTMITGDSSVELPAGETVDIPFIWTYDTSGFALLPSTTTARIYVDYKNYDHDDDVLLTWTAKADQTYSDTFEYEVLGDVGDEYTLDIMVEVRNTEGNWVDGSSEGFNLAVTVVEPDDVDDDNDGDTSDDVAEDIGELDFDSIIAGSVIMSVVLAVMVIIIFARRKN